MTSYGSRVLDDVGAFVVRFVRFPSEAAQTATVLWAAHAHLVDAFDCSPRIAFLSPEPGSGKTRAQEILELLVPKPMHVLSASPAAIFRSIQAERPTLLLDETDTIFTSRGKDDENQDLRGLLNSGYRNGATIPRCVGPKHEVEQFPTYCAVALAGLGDLPDTVMTRSVVVRMRRRAPGEQVEPYRRRIHRFDGELLQERLAGWAAEIEEKLTDYYPELPDGVTDRNADVWEPLIAIADLAGGDWPERARYAAVELIKAAQSTDSGSLGIRLLADLRTAFDGEPAAFTDTLLDRLHDMEEAPWQSLKGEPLDARGLAWRLRQYDIRPTKVRIRVSVRQGYRATDLHDAWSRYVPLPPGTAEHPEQPEHPWSEGVDGVPDSLDVPEHDRNTPELVGFFRGDGTPI